MKFEKFYADNTIAHAENCIKECGNWNDKEQIALVKRAIALDIQSMIGAANPVLDYEALQKLTTLYASVKAVEELHTK